MDRTKVTVWITASQAARLRLLSRQYRAEEAATLVSLIGQGFDRRNARLQILELRADNWPALEDVVAGAVERRLAEADLAGPWAPLSKSELDGMRLSGRWPGVPGDGVRLVQRNYALPSALVTDLRTASWRVSERPLAELEQLGLVGLTWANDREKNRRAELAERVHSPARIVRQALERYGPAAPAAEPNE